MPPRRFGPYEVLARLATGGAANIFLARKPHEEGVPTLSVLKTLLPERASDHEFVEMFLDEARLAARLAHPSCVEIYDLGKEGGTYYISMEYIVGETLWGLLASVPETRQPLPPLVVAAILASACEGLHHAHELKDPDGHAYNLVHRDVSPQNIMVSYEGHTKVLDFGIAKAETGRAATAVGIVKGKFSYMSPEQITGGAVDRRSDIYSLGIVLFECLAARRLYRADSPEEIARLMLERRPPRLRELVPDVDPVLDAICAKALARHPSGRYATAREMADALREHLHMHRFGEGVQPVQRLIEERFGPRIGDRRRILERAVQGNIEEAELLRVLHARPVMDVDLYPSADELGARPLSVIETETPAEEGPTHGVRTGGSTLERRGVRVELAPSGTPPEQIELSDRASRLSGDDESSSTRLDGDSTVLEGVEPSLRAHAPLDADTTGGEFEGRGLDAETMNGLEDVPVAQPRKKEGVRSDPRAQTRALGSGRRVAAATEVRVEVKSKPASPPAALGNEATQRPALEPRFASSALTSPELPGRTDVLLGAAMVVEPPRLVDTSASASGPAVMPDLSLVPSARPASSPGLSSASHAGPSSAAPRAPLVAPAAEVSPSLVSPDSAIGRAVASAPLAPSLEPLPYASGEEPQTYSLGVVLAALAFGVTLGLLLGVLISLFARG